MANTEDVPLVEFEALLGELHVRLYEEYPEAPGPSFSPTRFPYTYAADCLRVFPRLVPEDVRILADEGGPADEAWPPLSRGAAARQETVWAQRRGLNRALLAVALATVYCRQNAITVSFERYTEVMAEIRRGEHD